MTSPNELAVPGCFSWALGIEDTFIPQLAPGGRILDEYVLTQHDRFWRDDLRRIADVGVRHLRYGIPWYRVNPAAGVYDWSWTDEVLPYLVTDLGIEPILDLVHYGAPLWLDGTFLSPDYPGRIAEYAAAVANRYGSLIRSWTPLNEPIVHAHFSGRVGSWPPHRRGDRGYAAVLVALAEGIARTIEALRDTASDPLIVHVEAVSTTAVAEPGLEANTAIPRALNYLAADLAEGRVTPDHVLHGWLVDRGIPAARLAALEGGTRRIDVWGVNWYPQMSHHRLEAGPDGPQTRRARGTADDLAFAIRDTHARTGLPIIVTETSWYGRVRDRLRWLAALETMTHDLLADGVPLTGVTWFPAMSLFSWDYRRGRRPPEAYITHFGLWDLVPTPDGTLERVRTPVADAYEVLARGSA
ncbi:MAG TPA: family 1 glycosylhydrolase [Patescibacteria group bacterium]|nr:family 1 glycosylhydrolase [Patescibacteria group bacterium]